MYPPRLSLLFETIPNSSYLAQHRASCPPLNTSRLSSGGSLLPPSAPRRYCRLTPNWGPRAPCGPLGLLVRPTTPVQTVVLVVTTPCSSVLSCLVSSDSTGFQSNTVWARESCSTRSRTSTSSLPPRAASDLNVGTLTLRPPPG